MILDAIGIVSSNLEKTKDFYKILDLDLKQFENSDHYEAVTNSGLRIMVDSEELMKSINPNWKRGQGSPPMSLCFKQESPESVDEIYAKFKAAGFDCSKAPWDAFWGQRYAVVLDPDKNQVDLFAELTS